MDLFNLLTGPQLLKMTYSLLPEDRARPYPSTQVLAIFIGRTLSEDGSCQKAVNHWAAQPAADGLSVYGVNTVAYFKARQRLPFDMVTTLALHSAKLLSERGCSGWRWRG